MTEQTLSRVAFWLIPDAAERPTWSALMDRLAAREQAPPFPPHVTLYTCRRSANDREILADVARRTAPFSLMPIALETGERFTKSVFLRLARSAAIEALHRDFHAAVPRPSGYRLDPHLSLLYKLLPEDRRLDLAAQLEVPMKPIRFTAVQLVAIPEQTLGAQDVARWQRLAEFPLQGAGLQPEHL